MFDFIVFTIGTYSLGFYLGYKLTKKKYEKLGSNPNKHLDKEYERRLSTSRQTVQSGSSTNGEARSETK